MFNIFPVYCIINIYSKKFNIGYGYNLFIVISNFKIGFWLIICSKLNVVSFVKFMESRFAFSHSFIQLTAAVILIGKSFLFGLVTSILVLSANNIGMDIIYSSG